MEYTKEYTPFFSLLRSGLWEKDLIDLSPFPLSEEKWLEVYARSCRQTVQGIVYRGLSYLPSQLLPPEELLVRWMVESVRLEENNERTNKEIMALYTFFVSNGVHPILKKGQAAAALYEVPSLRVCGDIDLYFRTKEEYKCANLLIARRDIEIHRRADGSYDYNWHGIEVEHHATLVDLRNPFLSAYLKKLLQGNDFDENYFSESRSSKNDENRSSKINESSLYKIEVPSASITLLMFNAHIMKHALLSGIGLRQLCDMARAYYRFSGLYQGEELRLIYQKTGMMKWSRLLHSFLTEYLGLEKKYLPYEQDTVPAEKLLEAILWGGNFGQHAGDYNRKERGYFSKKNYMIKSIYRNRRISMDCALFEAFCWTAELICGQIHES